MTPTIKEVYLDELEHVKMAICLCECGNEFRARLSDIKRAHTSSCGCSQYKNRINNRRTFREVILEFSEFAKVDKTKVDEYFKQNKI